MRWWTPTPVWADRDVYIIGGGSSLKDFPWEVLTGKAVIGCNASFLLGVGVCPVTIFGDISFWYGFRAGLHEYARNGGLVVTNSPRAAARTDLPSWLCVMRRIREGLAKKALAWNGSTGAAAINLALLMGASRVLLLGFDMAAGPGGATHYHNAYGKWSESRNPPESFNLFKEKMLCIPRALEELFPGRRVLNLTENSGLDVFPKHSLKEHVEFLRRPAQLKEVS